MSMTYDHEHGAEQFIGHDKPAGDLENDSFVYVELSDVGESPVRWEQLAARSIDAEAAKFKVCCVPFFAYGISLSDIVITEPVEAHGVVDRVVTAVSEPSGDLTFRVQFLRASDSELSRVQLLTELSALGCVVEEWSPRMIAISANPNIASRVQDVLENEMARTGIEYERANPKDGPPVY
jgi:hypothetical protein